jgi:hypothetical protein
LLPLGVRKHVGSCASDSYAERMTKQAISLSDRRRRVHQRLSQLGAARTTRGEWQDLRDEFEYIGWDYDRAADLVLDWRRRRQKLGPVQVQSDAGAELAQFAWARSLRAVAEADTEPDVQQFRHDVLGDTLLTLEQVGSWVERQQVIDGPPTVRVLLPMPAGWRDGDPVTAASITVGGISRYVAQSGVGVQVGVEPELLDHTAEPDLLAYTVDGEWVSSAFVNRNGVLGKLRTLSERLAKRYNWQPAQASVYVLTGLTPVVRIFTLTTTMGTSGHHVTIDADPDVPVELVADVFKRARRDLLGPRARRPFGRGVRLVVHAAERPGVATRGLWQQWNRAHPDEQFDDLQSFRQALRNAQRRVDGQPRRQRAVG